MPKFKVGDRVIVAEDKEYGIPEELGYVMDVKEGFSDGVPRYEVYGEYTPSFWVNENELSIEEDVCEECGEDHDSVKISCRELAEVRDAERKAGWDPNP